MNKLKIGLLVDSKFSSKYVCEFIEWARQQATIEVGYLIICASERSSEVKIASRATAEGKSRSFGTRTLFRVIVAIETILLRRRPLHRDHLDQLDLSKDVKNQVFIEPQISKSGFVHRFSAADVGRVKALGLDLIVGCGSGILRGEMLEAARLGIIGFHHGDNRVVRGAPAGFWECYHQWPKTGFVIQRLTENLNGGIVLLRGNYATHYLYLLNQANLFKKSYLHLRNLVLRIAQTGDLPVAEEAYPYSGKLYRIPGAYQSVVYLGKIFYRHSWKIVERVLRIRKRWGISFIHANWRSASLWQSVAPAWPAGRFWADPFVYRHDGKAYCLVEEVPYKTKRGHITALEIREHEAVELGICLKEPFHLSFPFLFKFKGDLYMCPECFRSGQIRVYACKNFPLQWELASVLIQGVSAADTMLFEHHGRWWMLTNMDKAGAQDHSAELYLFYANSPLDTNWTAHSQNPIRLDSEGGRNAGLILEEGRIFRLGQAQGFDQYGEGLMVYEIAELSERAYKEVLVSTVDRHFRDRLLGIHHMSTTGTTTVFDHMSRSFGW